MSQNSLDGSSHLVFVAGDSLFGAGTALASIAGVDRVTHYFPELFDAIKDIREDWNWKPADKLIFIAAVDRSSDRQGGLLQKASEAGAIVDSLDYRDYYPSPPAGGAPNLPTKFRDGEVSDGSGAGDGQYRVQPSLAPRLSFLLGGVAAGISRSSRSRVTGAELLIVAHHFELKDSLLELVARGAKVGIAFYRSLMEARWERIGLFAANSPIKFYDLDAHVEKVTTLGLRRRPHLPDPSRSAASQLF